mmetsp:Transcript_4580/g.6828  ORF Transcript_4580/g.6828 Transcript_4580/m.6828 type:complete len:103 (-) Transcript_4580:131-439(-)
MACVTGTDRANNLIKSRALRITYGSDVLRVVRTVMDPSTKFNSHDIFTLSSDRVTSGHDSRKYFSRYLGNSVAKEDSSRSRPPGNVSSPPSSLDTHGLSQFQ